MCSAWFSWYILHVFGTLDAFCKDCTNCCLEKNKVKAFPTFFVGLSCLPLASNHSGIHLGQWFSFGGIPHLFLLPGHVWECPETCLVMLIEGTWGECATGKLSGETRDSTKQPTMHRTVSRIRKNYQVQNVPEDGNPLPPSSGSDFKDTTKVFWVFFLLIYFIISLPNYSKQLKAIFLLTQIKISFCIIC